MIIKEITTEVIKIPLKTPFITALRRVEDVEFVRVHVKSDNSFIGIGEAPATKAITNEGIEDILKSIEFSKTYLINKSLDNILTILHSEIDIGSSAKAALDIAFTSLHVQVEKQSFFEYFGAKKPVELHTDITISLQTSEQMFIEAKKACDAGMNILKVKLGKDINHAIEVTKLLANKLPQATLLIDANQAWNVAQSLEYVAAVKDLNIELIEQPVIANDINGMKEITCKSKIPILADESAFTLEDVKHIVDTKSANMINIKLMKCGGVSKAVEILEYARKNNITCMLGSMLEGPYSINIALHLAMAYTDVIKYIDLDSPLLYRKKADGLDFEYQGNRIFSHCFDEV